jgi:hypothetical protein
VENVLAYARLERGSARNRVESVRLSDLIERVKSRLVQRAGQAGMDLAVDGEENALATVVHVDVSAVEQILFNLVDNACKYAAPSAAEKIIHLEALPGGKFAMLRVRDHGQGISEQGARTLFQPFSKSAMKRRTPLPEWAWGWPCAAGSAEAWVAIYVWIDWSKAARALCSHCPLPVGPGCQSCVDRLSAKSPCQNGLNRERQIPTQPARNERAAIYTGFTHQFSDSAKIET